MRTPTFMPPSPARCYFCFSGGGYMGISFPSVCAAPREKKRGMRVVRACLVNLPSSSERTWGRDYRFSVPWLAHIPHTDSRGDCTAGLPSVVAFSYLVLVYSMSHRLTSFRVCMLREGNNITGYKYHRRGLWNRCRGVKLCFCNRLAS